MNLVTAGDIVLIRGNVSLYGQGDIVTLLGKLLCEKWLQANCCRIFNLETPLYDGDTPIQKCGPNLKAPTSTICGITALKPTLISLANNHILDHGNEGLKSTFNKLSENHLAFTGVGKDLEEAALPTIVNLGGKMVGVYTCTEHEFTIATETSPDANPFDPLESLDHISDLSQRVDYTIVLYYGGKEHYRYPSPYLQKLCRKMVEKGADLVVCQHSHCIGCEEDYKNAKIVYGQGNFIFDYSYSEFWQTSLLINLDLDSFEISYIPIEKHKKVVRMADDDKILKSFYERSRVLKDEDMLKQLYMKYAEEQLPYYLNSFHGKHLNSIPIKILNRVLRGKIRKGMIKRYYKQGQLLSIQNHLMCEAHRELIDNGILKKLMD